MDLLPRHATVVKRAAADGSSVETYVTLPLDLDPNDASAMTPDGFLFHLHRTGLSIRCLAHRESRPGPQMIRCHTAFVLTDRSVIHGRFRSHYQAARPTT
jgi:hypothetical protein